MARRKPYFLFLAISLFIFNFLCCAAGICIYVVNAKKGNLNFCRQKLFFQRKTICYRKLRSIDCEELNITLGNSPLVDEFRTNLDSLVNSYHSVLKFTLDAYAPKKTRHVCPGTLMILVYKRILGGSLNANGDLKNMQTENVIFSRTVLLTT